MASRQTMRYPTSVFGLKPSLGGYHAWQSKDMVHWVHHGSVTGTVSRWVTTAEQVGGMTYLYYDYPNDQDPHLFMDEDLTDGLPGKNMGLAFRDPTDGSDCTFIRGLDGAFHVIYEDWSPINAKAHSWDSPLAGHAVSMDGIRDFRILGHAVDQRTRPTIPSYYSAPTTDLPKTRTLLRWSGKDIIPARISVDRRPTCGTAVTGCRSSSVGLVAVSSLDPLVVNSWGRPT